MLNKLLLETNIKVIITVMSFYSLVNVDKSYNFSETLEIILTAQGCSEHQERKCIKKVHWVHSFKNI